MTLDLIKFWVNRRPSELRGMESIQGDTLKFSARIPLNSVGAESMPIARFIALDTLDPSQSVSTIGPKDFTATSNEALGMIDFILVLNPVDTANLILDSTLGVLLCLPSTDSRSTHPAKRLYIEIQLTTSEINKSWQGDLIIKGDLFKDNSGVLPVQKFILFQPPISI